MNDFIKHFSIFIKDAQFDTFAFWAFPIFTVIFIWLLTVVGLKVFSKREQLKTIFVVYRAWIISSMIAAGIIVGLISFWWTQNYFTKHPYQFSLLLSLTIAFVIPIFSFLNLRNLYSQQGIKEIADQPKTENQLIKTITYTKNEYKKNKYYYIIPLIGFLFLFLYLFKGTNLISLVFDNSGSMIRTTAIDALSETFDNLEQNNQIILTTLNGQFYRPKSNAKTSISELMQVKKSSALYAGNIMPFNNPLEAKNAVTQISGFDCCSPICESIWKTYLFIKETKANEFYKNKLLVIITDGDDNYINESMKSGKFFFNDEGFAEYFPPENVFIIDYSNGSNNEFMKLCKNSGCDIYPAENNKQDYIDGLDNALQSFKNNCSHCYWQCIF